MCDVCSVFVLLYLSAGVGKTSLISSLVSENFNARVPPVLQAVMVPPALMPERIQLTIIDTSSDPSHEAEIALHLSPPSAATTSAATAAAALATGAKATLLADVVLLVVAADVPESFTRVESYWLPMIESHARHSGVRIPVVLAINKSAHEDAAYAIDSSQSSLFSSTAAALAGASSASLFSHLVAGFRLRAVLPCSAKTMYHLSHVFFSCAKISLAPIEPLFDLRDDSLPSSAPPMPMGAPSATMKFKLLTQKALLRIFRLFNRRGDGVLTAEEMDDLHQVNFKGKKLSPVAFEQLVRLLLSQGAQKDYVRPIGPTGGVAGRTPPMGITFSGLLYVHHAFLLKDHHLFHTWHLLQAFGYQLPSNQTLANTAHATSTSGVPGLAPTQSLLRVGSSIASLSSAISASGAAPATTSSTAATALPPLGSLVLKEADYCTIGSPFQPALSYELTNMAIDFLTDIFHRYDTDHDGHLSISPPPPVEEEEDSSADATLNSHAVRNVSAASVAAVAASNICSLTAHSDLEAIFLTCPDMPFSASTFASFVAASTRGGRFINLDGWLAAWALLLHHYSAGSATEQTHARPGSNGLASSGTHGSTANLTAASSHGSFTSLHASAPASLASFISPAIVPNPDILLRYFAYICFPVTPAYPEFRLTNVDESGRSRARTRIYLPKLPQCIRVTPRNPALRADVDAALALNETIMSTDPGASVGSIRRQLADPSALKPRTVCCFVLGSSGSGRTAFIECMLGVAPKTTSAAHSQPVTAAVVPGLKYATTKIAGAAAGENNGASTIATEPSAPPSSSAAAQMQPRTYANRLPLSHVPLSADSASSGSAVDERARFLLLKDIPSSLGGALLSSPALTPTTSHLILLLYDGTSRASLEYVHAQLRICFDRRLPVLVVQTKADCADCSLPATDFLETDFRPRVEQFSARTFWTQVRQANQIVDGSARTHITDIFERIHQAATHPSLYLLSSVSAAARSSRMMRRLLLALLTGGAIVGLFAMRHYRRTQALQPASSQTIGTAAAAAIGLGANDGTVVHASEMRVETDTTRTDA